MGSTIVAPGTSREVQLRSLLKRVQSADPRDDNEFRTVFCEAKLLLEMSDTDVSEILLVSRPTVNRWTNGRNLPHTAMRRPIFDWIGRSVSRKIDNIARQALSRSYHYGASNQV